jgi:hypothetical protein
MPRASGASSPDFAVLSAWVPAFAGTTTKTVAGTIAENYSNPNSRNSRRICSGILDAPGAARDRSRGASLASR